MKTWTMFGLYFYKSVNISLFLLLFYFYLFWPLQLLERSFLHSFSGHLTSIFPEKFWISWLFLISCFFLGICCTFSDCLTNYLLFFLFLENFRFSRNSKYYWPHWMSTPQTLLGILAEASSCLLSNNCWISWFPARQFHAPSSPCSSIYPLSGTSPREERGGTCLPHSHGPHLSI